MTSASRLSSLAPGHREPVAEAVHLLWIDCVDLEAALDQRFDHRAVRDFDRRLDLTGLSSAARRHQPGGHLAQSLAAMFEDLLADLAAVAIGQKDAVALASPVDAGVPSSLIAHAPLPVQGRAAATFAGPCTGARRARCASGADSPRGVDRGQSIGARVPPR